MSFMIFPLFSCCLLGIVLSFLETFKKILFNEFVHLLGLTYFLLTITLFEFNLHAKDGVKRKHTYA